jgi:hypothetical protein
LALVSVHNATCGSLSWEITTIGHNTKCVTRDSPHLKIPFPQRQSAYHLPVNSLSVFTSECGNTIELSVTTNLVKSPHCYHEVTTTIFNEVKVNFKNNPPNIIQIAIVRSTAQTFTQT